MNATLAENLCRNHPAVCEVSDERNTDDGIWLYLVYGWINVATETHCIHEDTWDECKQEFANIQPCHCDDCGKSGNNRA